MTGNTWHCTLLTPVVQKYDGCTKVILIGAQRLSCGSQRLSCGAQGYPAVHNGYPGLTWVGARDTCVSKNIDVYIDIEMASPENIDIDKDILENVDIDIDKGILQNIDIDKISYRLGFGI